MLQLRNIDHKYKIELAKQVKYLLILSVFVAIHFSGCKKIPFDNRNKFCGKWKFSYSYYSWTYGVGTYGNESGNYDGQITYDRKDENKNSIIINYAPGLTATFELFNDNNLKSCGGDGKFINKKFISFNISSSQCDLAMGGGTYYTVNGTKQ